ncbi:transporter substrate-binding domain-containing protein [Alsobacter sp. KACC 23698]|uniref:Transporter substrate-binding domain-containing protein n=1 Tax=Alsobacter sp. KACC 23698 TaxID=3149229 RepID=A0AAU7JHA1_9HYPH
MRSARAAASAFVRRAVPTLFACACLLWISAATSGTAWAQEQLFIPQFWDPAQKPDKPDLSAIRVIRFLTEDDYPPMHFLTDDARLTGFNVDLARAVCEALNVACTVQARRWDTLLDALKEGRGDAVIASLRPTPELRAQFGFTAPYLRTPARFVARAGAAIDPSPAALDGKTVAVVARSAHENYLQTFFPKAVAKPFDDLARARAALQRGEADLLFADGLTMAVWLNGEEGECCGFVGGPYTESRWFGEGVSIATRRNETVLRRGIDWALQRVAERGTYAEIYLRYFPVGFY